MAHVFISYYHDDSDFAEVLINRIEKAGFETWVDSDRLHAGEDWRAEIDQAIKSALALVVIMTPEARNSEYVTYEWAFAWGAGVKVIPVLYKNTKLHPRLEALQYLNFTNRIARPWDALIEAVKSTANFEITSPTSNSPSLLPYIKQPIEMLNSADAQERATALESLMALDHPEVHRTLKEALHHPLQDVRFQAALARAKYKDIEAIPILLEAIYDRYNTSQYFDIRDIFYTSKAFQALVEFGYAATSSLLEALREGDVIIRIFAIEALGRIGDTSAIPVLLEALHDEKKEVRTSVVIALGQMRDTSVISVLLEALHDEDKDVREKAVNSLRLIGNVTAVPGLLEALHDKEFAVRRKAAEALGQIGDARAVPGLLKALNEDGGAQPSAAEALGEIGDATAVPGLLEALHETESYVLEPVIKALGQIGDVTAVPGLLELLYKERATILQNSTQKGQNYRFVLIQQAASKTILKIGDKATPYLIEALQLKNWDFRKIVIEILGKIGNPAAVPALLEISRNENDQRKNAIEALTKIGDVGAIPVLLEALQDKTISVRRSAVEALVKIGDASAVPNLIAALSNEHNQEVLRRASKALVNIGMSAVPDLIDALQNEKLNARRKGIVANVLRQIGTPEALATLKAQNVNNQNG